MSLFSLVADPEGLHGILTPACLTFTAPPCRRSDPGDSIVAMTDLVLLATVVATFAACLAYVRGLDRLLGSDDDRDGEVDR